MLILIYLLYEQKNDCSQQRQVPIPTHRFVLLLKIINTLYYVQLGR